MCQESAPIPLNRPRLVLRVGVLGNRCFGTACPNGVPGNPKNIGENVVEAAKRVFENIATTLNSELEADRRCRFPEIDGKLEYQGRLVLARLFGAWDRWNRLDREGRPAGVYRDVKPLIRIVTGRAKGSDQWLEEAGLSCVKSISSVEFVSQPVVVGSTDGHGANAFSVGALPKKTTDKGIAPMTREKALEQARSAGERTVGFRAQAEALQHHSDLLVAAWDPAAESKAGGTVETVALALARNIPVVALRVGADETVTISILERPADLDRLPSKDWIKDLQACVSRLVRFPEPQECHGESTEHRHFTAYHPRVAFDAFINREDLGRPWPAQSWKNLCEWVRSLSPDVRKTEPPQLKSPRSYADAKQRASTLSGDFGDAHRGGVLLSYVLGAVAVLLAILGGELHQRGAAEGWLFVVGMGEMAALVLLWALSSTSKLEDWHELYTDCRVLSEALRCMTYLAPLGVHTPIPKLPPHVAGELEGELVHDPRRTWGIWYFRAMVREAAILEDDSSTAKSPAEMQKLLQSEWVGDPSAHKSAEGATGSTPIKGNQYLYHLNAGRMHAQMFHGIEATTATAFLVILGAVAIHLAEGFFPEPGHEPVSNPTSSFNSILFLIGVGGPAFLAALTGFQAQIESRRLMQRSASMLNSLRERYRALGDVDTSDPDPVAARWGLACEAAATAAVLVNEAADWSMIYKNSDIHAG